MSPSVRRCCYFAAHSPYPIVFVMVAAVASAVADLGGIEQVEPLLPAHFCDQSLGNMAGIGVFVRRDEIEFLSGLPGSQ